LGQNFARQFDLRFQTEAGEEEYAWNTSWGVSTRLVGGLVMTHGDDDGLVLPPRLAPAQVVVVPILRGEGGGPVLEKAHEVAARLKDAGLRVRVDARDNLSPGAKFYDWERKGVPYRIEIGPRDLEKGQLALARRLVPEDGARKAFLPEEEGIARLPGLLDAFQAELLEAARAGGEAASGRGLASLGELEEAFESVAGFVYTGWSGDEVFEEEVKERTKATIRVIPDEEFRSSDRPAGCVSGTGPARDEVVWARAY